MATKKSKVDSKESKEKNAKKLLNKFHLKYLQALKKGDIVVYESTVYPGVTEDICVPILERESGLKGGIDFTVGFSPERINPGDKERSFTTIHKIVSGQDQATLWIFKSAYL